MLGIRKNKHRTVKSALKAFPKVLLDVLSFGYWRTSRRYYSLRLSYACVGTCLVVILSLGYLDCNWISLSVKTRRK